MIPLGYEVGTGEAVSVPLGHMAVTGMTRKSGKTTALEAMIDRTPSAKAIAFVTKRGEASFANAARVRPYFRERADWVFVASLIDTTLGEKNKLLRSWLMKACRGTTTLAEVLANVKSMKDKARGFSESIYTEIEGYLDLVVPSVSLVKWAKEVKLAPGLNVMDLVGLSTAMQSLVIRSTLDWVYQNETDTITVIPEAWEFLPEGRGNPVKAAVEVLIRKGGALQNWVWIDSQDMAGVWKLALRSASIWLIGVQREANEIKRTLANIPDSLVKPKSKDVATLKLGQFYVCYDDACLKTYVQPKWMFAEVAESVALGMVKPPPEPTHTPAYLPLEWKEEEMSDPKTDAKIVSVLDSIEAKLDEYLRRPQAVVHSAQELSFDPVAQNGGVASAPGDMDADDIYQIIKQRLMVEAPVLIAKLLIAKPEIRLTITHPVAEMDDRTVKGRLVRMVSEGFFDEPATGQAAFNELKRLGVKVAKPSVYNELKALARQGVVTIEAGLFKKSPDVKIVRLDK